MPLREARREPRPQPREEEPQPRAREPRPQPWEEERYGRRCAQTIHIHMHALTLLLMSVCVCVAATTKLVEIGIHSKLRHDVPQPIEVTRLPSK